MLEEGLAATLHQIGTKRLCQPVSQTHFTAKRFWCLWTLPVTFSSDRGQFPQLLSGFLSPLPNSVLFQDVTDTLRSTPWAGESPVNSWAFQNPDELIYFAISI